MRHKECKKDQPIDSHGYEAENSQGEGVKSNPESADHLQKV